MKNNIKKSKAILYIRVSGNEITKETFASNQEAMLTKYCTKNNIEIVEVIKDDCSAIDFKRPAWKQMMHRIRKGTLKADQLLFTRWDRFSRNAKAAYSMMEILHELQVFPQAIDQKIDFSDSEQRFLLALYLAGPEYESVPRARRPYRRNKK
ncbi:MAG TPA: recombinase family protein [Bacteroidia bacterium]|nr:recombinase family protein [Bacteroidia bacterium]